MGLCRREHCNIGVSFTAKMMSLLVGWSFIDSTSVCGLEGVIDPVSSAEDDPREKSILGTRLCRVSLHIFIRQSPILGNAWICLSNRRNGMKLVRFPVGSDPLLIPGYSTSLKPC